jgi:hypothetical protein
MDVGKMVSEAFERVKRIVNKSPLAIDEKRDR